MAHLGLLEQRLNSDPAFREGFLRDPVGVLRREGITMFPKQEQQLLAAVAKLGAGRQGVNIKAPDFTGAIHCTSSVDFTGH
ncbi:MAG TPA: hypothetical protein VGI95_03295 [Caulobacteraceae bacterium]|jgi:hypothetical protein